MGWTVLYRDPAWAGFDPRAVAAADAPTRRIKSTGSTAVYPFDDGAALIVKRRRVTGLRRWRASRARRAVATADALARSGVRTPTIRAAFERRRWGMLAASWVVSDRIDGDTLLERLSSDGAARLAAADAAGSLIGHTFGAGYRNRDWKAPNVVLDRDDAAWVVDLDGIRHVGRVDAALRRRDLTRLARDAWGAARPPTAAERDAFWAAYRRGYRSGRAAARATAEA